MFLLRRLAQAVVVIIIVSVLAFAMLKMLPGRPGRALLGAQASTEEVIRFEHRMGFDRPVIVQYGKYVGRLLRGDLGRSIKHNQPVTTLIAQRFPKTAVLFTLSTLLALVIAIPLGVLQGARRNKPIDYVLTAVTFVFYSVPVFFLALMSVLIFSVKLGWLPPTAPKGRKVGEILSQPKRLVLPVVTLALLTVALFSRYVRASVIDRLGEDYVRTARAKGLSGRQVLVRHVVRNSLTPLVTMLGLMLPGLFAGTVITEYVFNYQGMGLMFYDAVQQYDFAPLLATILLVSLATVVGTLLADIGYAVVDPRVTSSAR